MNTNSKPRRIAPFGAAGTHGDYRVLVATLQARQLETPTAQASVRPTAPDGASAPSLPLAEVLAGKPGWQDAVVAQNGSFDPGAARGRGA